MDTAILEDLGLTNAEIKVYLALLELGVSTAGPVLQKTGLQNSVVHMTLHKLVEKGFVSFIKKGKMKRYQAADPHHILHFIDEKKRRFETLLPELLVRQQVHERQEAEIYEGFKGFKAMMYEVLEEAQPGDEWLFFNFSTKHPENFGYVFDFYREFDNDRKQKGIIIKGIAPSNLKTENKGRSIDVRYVDYPVPLNFTIFRNNIIFTPFEDKVIAFRIRSRQLADQFRTYFYSIWNAQKSEKTAKPRSQSLKSGSGSQEKYQ